jgi:hypothetical protein
MRKALKHVAADTRLLAVHHRRKTSNMTQLLLSIVNSYAMMQRQRSLLVSRVETVEAEMSEDNEGGEPRDGAHEPGGGDGAPSAARGGAPAAAAPCSAARAAAGDALADAISDQLSKMVLEEGALAKPPEALWAAAESWGLNRLPTAELEGALPTMPVAFSKAVQSIDVAHIEPPTLPQAALGVAAMALLLHCTCVGDIAPFMNKRTASFVADDHTSTRGLRGRNGCTLQELRSRGARLRDGGELSAPPEVERGEETQVAARQPRDVLLAESSTVMKMCLAAPGVVKSPEAMRELCRDALGERRLRVVRDDADSAADAALNQGRKDSGDEGAYTPDVSRLLTHQWDIDSYQLKVAVKHGAKVTCSAARDDQ